MSTLRSFQLQFERQQEETAAELFRDLTEVVAVLYRSFVAQTEIHNDWSEEAAWPVWLASVQHEGYFFSTNEMKFIVRSFGFNLRIYLRNDGADSYYSCTALDPSLSNWREAVVELKRSHDRRGHFSRLWRDSAWQDFMDRITFDNNDHDACSQWSFDSVSSLSSSTTGSTTPGDDQNERRWTPWPKQ